VETQLIQPKPQPSRDVFAALQFEAPYLLERLVKNQIASSPEEAVALFDEVKKYLVLTATGERRMWQMYSLRVDEAWHQFILYTQQYSLFCTRHFGYYLHHSPNNAPKPNASVAASSPTFTDFQARYRELFGSDLPDVWFDERSLTPDSRLRNDIPGQLTVHARDDMRDLISPEGETLFAVNDLAAEAMMFLARTAVFYIRELPGQLEDGEKVELARTLVQCRILKVVG
jgi:hypothetical protein